MPDDRRAIMDAELRGADDALGRGAPHDADSMLRRALAIAEEAGEGWSASRIRIIRRRLSEPLRPEYHGVWPSMTAEQVRLALIMGLIGALLYDFPIKWEE